MSDMMSIGAALAAAILASLLCVAVMNRLRGHGKQDRVQTILDRDPMFGKTFLDRYYPDLPRQIVFEVRSEFARLAGIPADFLLPDDKLTFLGLASSPQAMQQFIVALISAGFGGENQVGAGAFLENLDTLDEYIRGAAELWQAKEKRLVDALSRENRSPATDGS